MFKIGVFGIITDDQNRVLLCHRLDYNLWNLPGGTLEVGEAPWECVIREVKEETGFEVEIVKLIGIYNKPEKNEICFSFACKIIGGQLTLNEEADKIEYFNIEKIPHNTSPKQVERIKDFFTNKNEIIYRNQIGPSSIELVKSGKL